jgi:hypothetical protein
MTEIEESSKRLVTTKLHGVTLYYSTLKWRQQIPQIRQYLTTKAHDVTSQYSTLIMEAGFSSEMLVHIYKNIYYHISLSYILKMEAASSTETLVPNYLNTRRHIPVILTL